MMKQSAHSVLNICFGCLRAIDSNTLNLYSFKLNFLVDNLQLQRAPFCAKCNKKAQETETFIQKVLANHNVIKMQYSEEMMEKLYVTKDHQIEIEEEVFSTGQTGPDNESAFQEDFINMDNYLNVNIKEEPMDVPPGTEINETEINENENETDEDETVIPGTEIPKTEIPKTDIPQTEMPEAETPSVSSQPMKLVRRHTLKVPVKVPAKRIDIQVPTLTLTLDECMKEREEAAKEQKYIESKWKCADCVKCFAFKDSYDKHMISHSAERGDHECDICKIRYPTAEMVVEHMKSHFIRFKCPKCDLVRIQRATIRIHYTAYHAEQKDQYECLVCQTKYTCYNTLKQHVRRSHSDKRLECPYCDATLSCTMTLRVHINRVHNKEEPSVIKPRPYTCDQCGLSFHYKSTMERHFDKHAASKQYHCKECDKYFVHKNTLEIHLRTAEPHVSYQELPFQCSVCEKRFGIKSHLNVHVKKVHSEEIYKCDLCDKAYKELGSLKKHQKKVHIGLKPPKNIACPTCDKKFASNSLLKNHQIIHTGDRPFECTKCTATFAHAGALYHHNNLVHLKKKRNKKTKKAKAYTEDGAIQNDSDLQLAIQSAMQSVMQTDMQMQGVCSSEGDWQQNI